ncbi:MAG TPA: glycosyltransferase [Paludibacter sp.]|nr:glycosyltransferase [Paludibacter sp.]
MGYLFGCVAFVSFLYLILILIFIIGWRRIYAFVPKGNESIKTLISVVVACRNEEEHVRQLIACMAQQSNQNFELIVVNDHSTDATRNYIKAAQTQYPKIQLVDAVGYGKKNALKEGILNASGNLIVTTDADCLPSYHWLESIACYQRKNNCDLIICPVKLSGKDSLFTYLQVLEFTSLVASAAGAAGMGMPILCNGANLVFTKKTWMASKEDLHPEEQSGDDIFLLESVKKREGKIRFLKSESAFVTTKQAGTLTDLIKQRRRWSAKSRLYTDWQLIFTALVVFSVCLLLLTLVVLSFYKMTLLYVLIALFLFKYLLDSIFLSTVSKFFQLNNIWFFSFLLSIFYPFYIVFVAVSSLVFRPKKWN